MQHPTHKSIWSSIFYWHRHDLRSTSSAQQLQRYSRDLCLILYQAHLSAHLFTCASVHEWYKDISAEVYFEAGSAGVYSCLVKSYFIYYYLLRTGGAASDSGSEKKACAACFFRSCVTERELQECAGLAAFPCVSVCRQVRTNVWARSVICQWSGYMCVCFERSDWRSMEPHIWLSCAAEKCL